MADQIDTSKTEYQHVSTSEPDASQSSDSNITNALEQQPRTNTTRPLITTFALQVLTLLWLVPIAALVWLNVSEHKIGASVWCPNGDCYRSQWSNNAYTKAAEFDERDHSILGGLQFVAKALEVWFVFVAGALLYLVTLNIAEQKEGIPIGFLTKPLHFAITTKPTSHLAHDGIPRSRKNHPGRTTNSSYKLLFLTLLSIALFALCNLMGPATAVLVLPALQWMSTPKVPIGKLDQVNNASPPSPDATSWFAGSAYSNYCNIDNITAENFLCTRTPFGDSLDGWIASSVVTNGDPVGFASQDLLTFQLNFTAGWTNAAGQISEGRDLVWWSPSRQVVSWLSWTYDWLRSVSRGSEVPEISNGQSWNADDVVDSFTDLNRSLSSQVRRYGPVIGAVSNMWLDYNDDSLRTIELGLNRSVRCYDSYNIYWTPVVRGRNEGNYTKCIRFGSGWDGDNYWNRFYVDGRWNAVNKTFGNPSIVQILSSDRAVFLPNGTLPSWLDSRCLTPGPVSNSTSCDWDRFFTVSEDDPMYNRTSNTVTMEYIMDRNNSRVRLAVDFAAFLSFTDYVLDPSPSSNPMNLVRMEQLPQHPNLKDTRPIFVHPSWALAGWSAVSEGTIFNRPSTNSLSMVLESLLANQDLGLNYYEYSRDLDWVTLLPILHTLSLIDHDVLVAPEGWTGRQEDAWRPVLYQHARVFIWSYSLSSKTSKLGVVVVLLGAIVVVAQAALGFLDRRRYRSPTQLLVAALEHEPNGEFAGSGHKEGEIARALFRVEDDDTRAGKFRFRGL